VPEQLASKTTRNPSSFVNPPVGRGNTLAGSIATNTPRMTRARNTPVISPPTAKQPKPAMNTISLSRNHAVETQAVAPWIFA